MGELRTFVVRSVEPLGDDRVVLLCDGGVSIELMVSGRRRELWLATEPGTTFDLTG